MPRGIKRRAKAKTEWTSHHRAHLLTGYDHFGRAFGGREALDLDLARAAWEELREELLAEFIADRPFERPAAWWWFDAPEPRREATEREDNPDAENWVGSPAWWANHRERPEADALASRGCESFRAYLTRLGLLTPEELHLAKIERHRRANP
jgi:hypothetical protein